jgi:hypothetical protein
MSKRRNWYILISDARRICSGPLHVVALYQADGRGEGPPEGNR